MKPASSKVNESRLTIKVSLGGKHTGFINTVKWKTDSQILRGPNTSLYLRKKIHHKISGAEVSLYCGFYWHYYKSSSWNTLKNKMFKTMSNKHFHCLNLNTKWRLKIRGIKKKINKFFQNVTVHSMGWKFRNNSGDLFNRFFSRPGLFWSESIKRQ